MRDSPPTAGVSPSQAPIDTTVKVDLYGTVVLLEKVGKVIALGGVRAAISSQSGHGMPQLSAQEDKQLAKSETKWSGRVFQGSSFQEAVHHITAYLQELQFIK